MKPATLREVCLILETLYQDVPQFKLKQCSRDAIEEQDKLGDLVYGEVPVLALNFILDRAISLVPGKCSTFWDLGSGSGQTLVAAALLHPDLTSVHGIEIIPALHDIAVQALSRFQGTHGHQELHQHAASRIHLDVGDFMQGNVSDGDVLLVHGTCFTLKTICALVEYLAWCCHKGAVLVMITHQVEHQSWKLVHSAERRMSWGPANVQFYQHT